MRIIEIGKTMDKTTNRHCCNRLFFCCMSSSDDDQLQSSKDLLLSILNQVTSSQIQNLGDMAEGDEELSEALRELEAAKNRLLKAQETAKDNVRSLESLSEAEQMAAIVNIAHGIEKQLASAEEKLKR